jgi:hypothetical protein
MTKAEMQAEINRLLQRVAELEGEIKGLQFLVSLPKREELPYYIAPATPWTWPAPATPMWTITASDMNF